MRFKDMKTLKSSLLRKFTLLAGTAVVTAFVTDTLPARDLNNPVNPNAPSPNAGIASGHRAAGAFTARRPGNLPKYGPRAHSFTGVTSQTP
jgi:hypothetical protein